MSTNRRSSDGRCQHIRHTERATATELSNRSPRPFAWRFLSDEELDPGSPKVLPPSRQRIPPPIAASAGQAPPSRQGILPPVDAPTRQALPSRQPYILPLAETTNASRRWSLTTLFASSRKPATRVRASGRRCKPLRAFGRLPRGPGKRCCNSRPCTAPTSPRVARVVSTRTARPRRRLWSASRRS